MARYNRLPSLTSGIGHVASSGGGFAVVINPPASSKSATPAATSLRMVSQSKLVATSEGTYHSQHPPSHQISKEPIATYARSSVALPKLRTPCTIPPLPDLPPSSVAILTKLSILRCMLPSGMSLLSLPHSHEKTQPAGAFSGIGAIGLRTSGSCCVSFRNAPRPAHEEKNWLMNGA